MSPVRGSSWTASGQRERSNLEFLGRFCTTSPQAFQPSEVEVQGGGGVKRKLRTSSPGRLSRESLLVPARSPPKYLFLARKIPSLCLREEALPRLETGRATPGQAFPAGLSPSRGRIGWPHWRLGQTTRPTTLSQVRFHLSPTS